MDRSQQSATFLQGQDIHALWESDYLNPDMDRFYDRAFTDIIARIPINPSDHILDAGCGYCFHTKRLAKSGARITAIDFSQAALNEARKNLAGLPVELQQADLTNLPFPDASFNHAVCWGVLMHIPNINGALDELSRVLKPGGTLVLSENNMRAPDIAIRERLLRGIKRTLGRENPEVRRTPAGLEVWTDRNNGGLMVRKTDMGWLKNSMAERGMTQTHRTAGQLTEGYTNLPTRALKRAVYALNAGYYGRAPQLAAGNILHFLKVVV